MHLGISHLVCPDDEVSLTVKRDPSRALLTVPNEPEEFGLVQGVMECLMVPCPLRFQSFCNTIRAGVGPRASRRTHVVRLDVERGEAEWVLADEAMEIVIHERPVERSVETNEYKRLISIHQAGCPIAETAHRLLGIEPRPSQIVQREAGNFERLRVRVVIDRFQFAGEGLCRVIDSARPDRKQTIFSGDRPSGLNGIDIYERPLLAKGFLICGEVGLQSSIRPLRAVHVDRGP